MNAGALPSMACTGRLPQVVGLLVLLTETRAQKLLLFITRARGSPKLIRARLPFLEISSQIITMVKNHHLSKSMLDASWGAFLHIFEAKTASAGHQVIRVNPRFTSQKCYGMGS
jgi:transposase